MNDVTAPSVIAADRMNGNVVIEFEDGMCGIFTSELLYSMLSQALPLPEPETPEGERREILN